jgi:hypothetical protein
VKTLIRARALGAAVLITILAAGNLMAQSPAPDSDTAALLKKVEALEQSLSEVKAELARRAAAVTPEPAAPTPPAAVPDTGDIHTLGPLQFRGYGDFTFGRPVFENMPPGGIANSAQSFSLGDFDLFVTSNVGSHLRMLAELLITSDYTNLFSPELDRMMLTYKFNDYLSITAGKFNTAIGFYTNEFHRARYFQTATGRPLMFSDEDVGGVLPVHSVGVSMTGAIPSGSLGAHWVAEVANGRDVTGTGGTSVQNFVDNNNGKAVNFALYVRPEWLSGFQSGASFYRDQLYPPGAAGAVDERIYSTYAALVRPHTELIAEGALIQDNDALTGRLTQVVTSYAQASQLFGRVRPYFRYDYQNAASSDPIFGYLGRRSGPSAGVRFDLGDFVALKVQFGRLADTTAHVSTNDAQAQVAFAF